jgi:hypothetical protein
MELAKKIKTITSKKIKTITSKKNKTITSKKNKTITSKKNKTITPKKNSFTEFLKKNSIKKLVAALILSGIGSALISKILYYKFKTTSKNVSSIPLFPGALANPRDPDTLNETHIPLSVKSNEYKNPVSKFDPRRLLYQME